ncbi:hypothetical protein Selin_1432 [Desulfurispirillum indicum S5]|uniref:Uncharacterized protein n=1 Tax=Desulfurispirillum indicum (strain ATCC BAA-1389 / DSM 22839 / S5) TaxID=653733 RepID=E6W6D0_DESIS|nr:hypothetical protein [Desulfurispirillum indicum]ADU66166.1 hypothetical protein Selin_1432 [Desulfurispirillum indicum S5]
MYEKENFWEVLYISERILSAHFKRSVFINPAPPHDVFIYSKDRTVSVRDQIPYSVLKTILASISHLNESRIFTRRMTHSYRRIRILQRSRQILQARVLRVTLSRDLILELPGIHIKGLCSFKHQTRLAKSLDINSSVHVYPVAVRDGVVMCSMQHPVIPEALLRQKLNQDHSHIQFECTYRLPGIKAVITTNHKIPWQAIKATAKEIGEQILIKLDGQHVQ